MRHFAPLSIPLILTLSACSSGSSTTDIPNEGPQSYGEALEIFEVSRDTVLFMVETPGPDLPTSGSARYNGATEVFNQFGIGIYGTAELDVTFGALSDVTGVATNFYQTNGEAVEGSLTIDNGYVIGSSTANPTPTYIAADIEGTVRSETGNLWSVAPARLEGNFFGANGDAIRLHADTLVSINGDALPGEILIYALQ